MLGLSLQTPCVRPVHDDAVARALAVAGTVSGGYAGAPCTFVRLDPQAERLALALCPEAAGGGWVLVTMRGADEEGHRIHLRERSLTAAQRFMLALACDGVDSRWVTPAPSAAVFQAAGVALTGHVPVGLIWCGGG